MTPRLILAIAATTCALACKEQQLTQNEITNVQNECGPSDYHCIGDDIHECNDAGDGWVKVKTCPANTCVEGRPTCGAVCEPGKNRCDDRTLQVCADSGTEWEDVMVCAVGACVQGESTCEQAECVENEDCTESGLCLPVGECEPPTVTLSGFVQRYDALSASFEDGVTVRITNKLPAPDPISSEPGTGRFEFSKLPPDALIDLDLTWSDQRSPVTIPLAVTKTRVSTHTAQGATKKLNPPVVGFNWLARVAVDCGVFTDVMEATGESNGSFNAYWLERSTVLGEVRDADGRPVAGIPRGDISVRLGTVTNVHSAPTASDSEPTTVCFLDADADGNFLVGSRSDESTDTGRFVVFRVRNEKNVGAGIADVNVKGFASASVSLRASGNIGVVQIGEGEDFGPQPERPRDFETDVYKVFKDHSCRGCHSPPPDGADESDFAGYLQSKERGEERLRANFGGTPDEVYAVLMADDGEDCTDPETPARVCLEDPEASLLLRKPFAEEDKQDHATVSFEDPLHPDYRALLEWIKQGAKR